MMGNGGDQPSGEDQDDWGADAGEPLETERLALDDEGERLPWLESTDDDDADTYGSDHSQLLRLGLIGSVALVLIVGAIWWVSNRGADAPVADGSTVAAPATPYKDAPKDPGGKTFDGTGDSSFAVSEGQTRPGQLAQGEASAAPSATAPSPAAPSASVSATGAASAAASAKPSAAPAAPAAGSGIGVQVGAYSSKAGAEAGWSRLVAQSNGLLSGVSHRVVAGSADNGTIYRLQAVSPNAEAARTLCGKLKGAGIPCQVK